MAQWEYCKLSYDGDSISYISYQHNGPYQVRRPYTAQLWSWCLHTLGLIGWEATGTMSTPTEQVAWYFKRELDLSNEPLQF
jgi:hypothetical protein